MDRFSNVNLTQPEKKKHFQQPKTHHDSIRKLLTILAASQQATLQETGYVTYCNGLDGFLLEDLETSIGELCLRERPEGRTAFPSLATIVSETQRAANRRFQRARQQRERESAEYARAHPEEFVPFSEIIAAVAKRRELRALGHIIPIEPRPRDGFYGYERDGK